MLQKVNAWLLIDWYFVMPPYSNIEKSHLIFSMFNSWNKLAVSQTKAIKIEFSGKRKTGFTKKTFTSKRI